MSDEPTPELTSFEKMVLQRFDQIDAQLVTVETQQAETNERLGKLEAKALETNERLGRLEAKALDTNERLGKLEAKALDTRPIWERVLAEILDVKEHLELVEDQLGVLNKDTLKVRARQDRLEKRLDEMEETKPL